MGRKEKKYNYIYKITNIKNNKFYIGMHSTNNLDDGYFGSGKRLWYSINYHGKENHIKEILEYLPSRKLLKEREKEIVNEDLIGEELCLNLALGGSGGIKFTDEIKVKMSLNHADFNGVKNPMYGKTFKEIWDNKFDEEESELKFKEWLKKRVILSSGENNGMYGSCRSGTTNPFYGKKHSEETKKRLKEKSKKKKVLQYTKDGELIKEWDSTMDVYRELKINCRNCCRGLTKTAGGYKWNYKI